MSIIDLSNILEYNHFISQFGLTELGKSRLIKSHVIELGETETVREKYWLHIFPNLMIIVLSILPLNALYFLLFRNNVSIKEYKFIYISRNSHIVKSAIISKLLNNLVFLYPPSADIKNLLKHYKVMKNNRNSYIFSRFAFNYKLLYKILEYIFFIAPKISKKITVKQKLFHIRVIKDLIYYYWSNNYIKNFVRDTHKKIVLTEHDSAGAFLFLIQALNREGITTIQMQHGNFLKGNKEYIPITKYFFSCSKRERDILVSENISPSRIFVYGAPLQYFSHEKPHEYNSKQQYKALVIASEINQANKTRDISLYRNIDSLFNKGEYLFRFRPSSRENDFDFIHDYLNNAVITKSENSLLEDIFCSELIISFSIDSLTHCLQMQKKVVFIPYINTVLPISFIGKNEFIQVVTNEEELMRAVGNESNLELDNLLRTQFIINNFGTTNLEELKSNLDESLRKVENLKL